MGFASAVKVFWRVAEVLKGTATLMTTMLYMKGLNKLCILIPVSYKSMKNVEVVGV